MHGRARASGRPRSRPAAACGGRRAAISAPRPPRRGRWPPTIRSRAARSMRAPIPAPSSTAAARVDDLLDEASTVAHRQQHARGHAALARAAGERVDHAATVSASSASGTTMRWFLAPPRQSARLPSAVRARVDGPRRRGGAHEGDGARRPGGRPAPRPRPVAVDQREDTGRDSPPRASARPGAHAVRGTFSEGLRMKALPTVTAIGNIHNGTIAGKLKGVIPATTPSGSRRALAAAPRG